MAHVSIIGTGNMGQAIAGDRRQGRQHRRAARPRPTPTSRSPATSSSSPSPTRPSPTSSRSAATSLAGKVVVDITNPLNFETFDSLAVPADGSAAAEIAAALPDSAVLKAFNTTFAATLAAGTVGPLPTTVLIAGDDADAKALLAGIVTAGGLNADRRRLAAPGPRARGPRLPAAHPRRRREGLLDRRLRGLRLIVLAGEPSGSVVSGCYFGWHPDAAVDADDLGVHVGVGDALDRPCWPARRARRVAWGTARSRRAWP